MLCFKVETDTKPQHPQRVFREGSGHSETPKPPDERAANTASTSTVSANMAHGRSSNILLATAVVLIEDDTGARYPARALLDSGSECNFMSERLSQRLSIRREKVDVSVMGIGHAAAKARQRIQATIKSRVSMFCRSLSFLVLPRVTVDLPTVSVQTAALAIPDGVELADPEFFKSSVVDLVLGIQAFFSFFRTGKEITLGNGLPLLTETVFGWIVSGEVADTTSSSRTMCNIAISDNLEKLMARFWSCEEVGAVNNYSPEEARCEEQFGRTVKRGSNGRYTVALPKDENLLSKLGESKDIAYRRLLGLERRLARDEDLKRQYTKFMAEYLTLGHMHKLESAAMGEGKRCYLPHHPVVKEGSTTTKVRVVFDASCKTSSGVSLNDVLLVGPVIQQDLRTIVLRSRTRQIMVVADVEKMFRQINMNQADIPLQCILWRFGSEEDVAIYELATVTYGTKPAPFLATRTLKQLALDEGHKFPRAAQAVDEDIYMDDVISGADDVDTAVELRKQLAAMMASGGFKLRKWASNCPDVLDGIPQDCLALPDSEEVNWDQDQAVKTLGLTWFPKTDCFKYQFRLPMLEPNETLTKRKVLSAIAMLFDPLGLLGATIILAKLFMQRLWCLRDEEGNRWDWDVPLPRTVGEEWRSYYEQLQSLNELCIPRCAIISRAENIQLHCFSDASEKAYGACLYIRSVDNQGTVSIKLFTAKSKVAPVKVQTLPRLELCGALLAAQLVEKATEAIKGPYQIYFWTDSTCVLRWISATPTTWTTFVANRVAKIQRITENHIWRHVPGISNPADLISRGVWPNAIKECSLWWDSPRWLRLEMDDWPKQQTLSLEDMQEKRRMVTTCVASGEQTFSVWFISKFSSYTKLIRSTAYWLRLMTSLRSVNERGKNGFLSTTELRQAELVIVRQVQRESFSKERNAISNGNNVIRSWFNPTITDDGILRIGGRLGQSTESYQVQHPMILPSKHSLTDMVMQHYHEQLLHAGPQLLLATVRLRFWPLGGRNAARKIVHRCLRCFRAKPSIIQQQMGELPSARVTVSRPFSRTGVDYFGPVYIREGRRRAVLKAYVAVFVCMCTKAVHLELVTDLSTERFLQALRRFTARRGRCTDIYSDNGTNFVGARNQIRALFTLLKDQNHQEAVIKECVNQGIHWHFNPPGAPHFGGLWEAAVRSAKFHLLRVLGGNSVSLEDFSTLLVQVEGCLNSRPLTSLSEDPTDLEPLTPAHFLTGGSLQAIPEPDHSAIQINRLNRWQMVQRQLQDFWKRWRTEYLSQLQGRTKNWKPAVEVQVGKLVVVVDANCPPLRWKMGRIHQLHPGPDGITRVATVKTSTGYLTRPVVKLCLLPTEEN
ncbi:uncharacterized protein LOC131686993 [Topomyia yanbarensis]|uniref:uncharacterized protein LOC131686993 n=1 Tax=Topomyia yanbarensis TaxID=2498891 RepID=UPI00273AF719|nr:uncharacterized protein LOC131686993 [Topomyia yanbarensis]